VDAAGATRGVDIHPAKPGLYGWYKPGFYSVPRTSIACQFLISKCPCFSGISPLYFQFSSILFRFSLLT
jgi:hypothetical protein